MENVVQNKSNLIVKFFSDITTKKAILVISILGIIVFGNSLGNGFVGDDISQLVSKPEAQSIKNIGGFFSGRVVLNVTYYKPLFNTVNAIIYTLFGGSPVAFHAVQLLLYIVSAILLFFVLTNFLKTSLAFLLTLVFIAHPFNSEVVYFISNLQDVLFFFFGILAIWKLINTKSIWGLVGVTFLLFLSIMSKETGALFFLIAILYSLIFNRKFLYQFLGLVGFAGLMYLGLRMNALGLFSLPLLAPIAQLSLSQRLIHIPALLFFYIKTFLFPLNLSVSYHWIIEHINSSNFFLPLFIDALVLGAITFLGMKLYKSRGNSYFKIYIFFTLWLIIGLLLHIQIIPLDATVADRWFYFPMVGVLGIIGTLLYAYNINLANKYVLSIIIVVLGLLSTRTFVRSFDWRDEFTLASHDSKVSDSHILENVLATKYFMLGNYDAAKFHAEKSVSLFPYQSNLNIMGSIYFSLREYDFAKEWYEKALRLGDSKVTYSNLALIAIVRGDDLENTKLFIQNALEKYPSDPLLLSHLAIVEYKLGNAENAKAVIRAAYSYDGRMYIKGIYDAIMSGKENLEFNLTP